MPNPELGQSPKIRFDTYQGIGKDYLRINQSIADSFMRTADLRSDILVVEKTPISTSTIVQEGLGICHFPEHIQRLFGFPDETLQIRREGEVYFIEVDDKRIWEEIEDEQRFPQNLSSKITKGLGECLIEDKVFNGGRVGLDFAFGYLGFAFVDLYLAGGGIIRSIQEQNTALIAPYAAVVVVGHFFFNTLGRFFANLADLSNFGQKVWFGPLTPPFPDNPFIRRSVQESLAPPVPIDRLIRGAWFLLKHKEDLIYHI